MNSKTFSALRSWTTLFAVLALGLFSLLMSGCSAPIFHGPLFSAGSPYLESGTVIISHQVPAKGEMFASKDFDPSEAQIAAHQAPARLLAPLVGYFPPAVTYLPADNETWLEINRDSKTLVLYKGKGVIKEIQGEGVVSIAPGDYYLQHKQKQPLWYAPNDYFAKRQLEVPSANDRLRYRRGALGKFALFPTTTFPIHCAPVWTEDVGGLRVSANDLSSIYYMLPVGAPIVVK